jgi:hypothetical protein
MIFKSPAAAAAVQREPAPRRTASNKILLLVLPLLVAASTAELASNPLLDAVPAAASTAAAAPGPRPTFAAQAAPEAVAGPETLAGGADPDAIAGQAGPEMIGTPGTPPGDSTPGTPFGDSTPGTSPGDSTPAAASAGLAAPEAASLAAPVVWGRVEGLAPQALRMALDAVSCARASGASGRPDLLTVIDYSLPSTTPRLWVLDLGRHRVLYHELVAHGAGSGDNFATRFSNTMDSRQSSLGLFLTGGTYEGGNGYSLKLRGLDAGVNDRAEQRNIVIHGAWYVSAEHASQYGRLGRSWGCPALPQAVAHRVIDTIKDGSFVFSYAPRATVLQAASRSACAVSRAAPAVSRPVPAVSRAARATVAASVAAVKAVVATP